MRPELDTRWMRRALELARRGRFGASPNPMVGAVLLDRHDRLAGEGYHAAFGGPHAELVALASAGDRARGGTLYVTLEPCNHHGKTPPCVTAVVNAGVARVVVAMRDPSHAAGGGLEALSELGVSTEVMTGECAELSAILTRRWLRWATDRRPWVTMKAAVSLDGRIATRTGQSQWITGTSARQRGHGMREEHDAILVGVGTVLADDPRLTRRLGTNPVDRWRRIILDTRLRTPPDAIVVRSRPQITTIVHTSAAPPEHRHRLRDAGVRLLEVDADEHGRPSLAALLDHLAQEEVAALLVEGGATVHGAFVDAGLVDEAVYFVAPMILGGPAPPAVAGTGIAELSCAPKLCFEAVRRCGDDLEIRAVVPEAADVHGPG